MYNKYVLINFIKNSTLKTLAILMLTLFCSCSKAFFVDSNAFSDKQAIPQGFPASSSFMVISLYQNNQIFAKDVTKKIQNILLDKGYTIAEDALADYYLIYDIKTKTSSSIRSVPKYIPGQTQSTYGNIYGTQGGVASYQEKTQTAGTTIYVPQQATHTKTHLSVWVYDAHLYRATQQEEQLWNCVSSTSIPYDLREIIDGLLLETFKHFGCDTNKEVTELVVPGRKEMDDFKKVIYKDSLSGSCD
ncbi:MAG: hypothetical protein JSR37_03680 [Verrucomicrobia bacterium]|nr:hypothetical protein [Verrucomicrobiota bacterium]